MRQLAQTVDLGALHARDLTELTLQGLGGATQFRQVVPGHLDHDLPLDLRDGLEHVVPDRLRERRVDARDAGELKIHFLDQLLTRESLAPLFHRFHIHEHLGHAEGFGVGAVFRLAGLGDHRSHLGNLEQLGASTT